MIGLPDFLSNLGSHIRWVLIVVLLFVTKGIAIALLGIPHRLRTGAHLGGHEVPRPLVPRV